MMWATNKLRSYRLRGSSETVIARLLSLSFLFFFIKGMVWLAIFSLTYFQFFQA